VRLASGARLGPYEILAPIGAGGMGEVYRARDTRLGRDVAVKVIIPRFAADADLLRRFEQEARAASQLDHPNILVVHDIGSHEGSPYIVSELLDGESLREKLGAPLPPKKAVEYALQVAHGLAAAHEKGIVHRDLKPENLFVTRDGRVKILDFGVAKLTHPAIPSVALTEAPTAAPATGTGVVIGTVGYMSPEQVLGKPLDSRSDLFSLGVILYEMLSGKRPFQKDTIPETVAAILKEEPPELSGAQRAAAPGLDRIVRHCLEKDPTTRFQTARDLGFDLEDLSRQLETSPSGHPAATRRFPRGVWIAAAIAALAGAALLLARLVSRPPAPGAAAKEAADARPTRIVVLPFENLGPPDDAYFASGMTEEITSRLASVHSLAVISRTTATQYDRRGKTVEQIGKDLSVGYVLEGSVRWDRSGGGPGRVRITPQLIRVSDDTHLWSERYDRLLPDIFAIQGDVADGVVRAMNLTLAPAESTALKHMPTHDLQAYDLYLRALELEKRNFEPSVVAQQIKLASQAVERDPKFAEALALLARVRISNYWLYYDRRESELERARVDAERAIALRPNSAEAHLALGYYHYQGRLDYQAALAEYREVLTLQPNGSDALSALGAVYRRQGKWQEAEGLFRKALDGDPRNGSLWFLLGETQLILRVYPDAIRNLEISSSLNPAYHWGHCYQAWAHVLWHGDVASSRRVLSAASALSSLDDPGGLVDYFSVRTAEVARDWEGALRRLDARKLEAVTGQLLYVPMPLLRAEVLFFLGRRDPARQSYEEARRILAQKIQETPEDSRLYSSLGLALAGLDRMAEAVREGERGVELLPPDKEAFRGVYQEAAIRQLDILLSRPSQVSVTLLRIDPWWDPLRKNPKFDALLAKYEAKP
jgi:serine/threonine protein kinase/tetratricopeptide (TPR) repeat protein